MIHTFAISGYRSIRSLVLPLDRLTVITGRNGTGKSSFYRALRLLADVAQGRVIASLAAEGGLQSTLWAGPERISREMRQGTQEIQGTVRKERVSLKLGFASDDYGYAIDLGLPVAAQGSMFNLDPEIKAEAVWVGEALSRSNTFATRSGPAVTALDETGRRHTPITNLPPYESMMMQAADPRNLAELLVLRERMRGWRFYDHFRTDAEAPARSARIGTRTPVLSADGSDLPAALQTIREIGDKEALAAAIDDAFPRASMAIEESGGKLELLMHQHGLLRSLRAAELSDGTLRYLLLLAALLTPRPPGLMVLNEPETSLHPELLAPLARLIRDASASCQIIVVTHAAPLVEALAEAGIRGYELTKSLGETRIDGVEPVPWSWPGR
ncbi:AAA family ATPase [Chelativorans sp. M5D2P16]|uniref:AAA family ATPase n=1 Tax=Chelativorans sp. M5D2P16 TaxID=3095678 RepID=UPI002ACA7C63|nr:AAA family ATPase [Chelativorans sp. M5D2P16]MDZ5696844.1 AAA family ATPase [Chelativorans sp. M5D2P16]